MDSSGSVHLFLRQFQLLILSSKGNDNKGISLVNESTGFFQCDEVSMATALILIQTLQLTFYPGGKGLLEETDCHISFPCMLEGKEGQIELPWTWPYLLHVLRLMLKTRPLCTSAEPNLRDRVLGEVEKNSLTALLGKAGYSGLVPLNNSVSQTGRIW